MEIIRQHQEYFSRVVDERGYPELCPGWYARYNISRIILELDGAARWRTSTLRAVQRAG